MNKGKFFTAVITVGISVIILLIVVNIMFGENKINQGNYIISDAIVTSVVEFEDKAEKADEWKYDVSQTNKVSMLLQTLGDATIKQIYLDNFKVNTKNNVHIYIEQKEYALKYKYENIKDEKVNIYTEEAKDGNYIIEFNIINEDIISNYIVPEETKELRHDGTIINIVKMSASDIKFKVKYDLVVVQNNERINTCKVEMEMPNEKISTEGFYVQRLDSANYNFKVKY